MESKSTSGVLRRTRPLGASYRYYPYASGTGSGKEDVKQEVVRLGVELSLSVAESMFLLCDDIRTMLWFCFKLWKYTIPPSEPVSERLLRVIQYVYSKDIKPKNRVYNQDGGNSAQWELIRTTWKDFTDGVIVLNRFVGVLRRKDRSFDDRLLSSAMKQYKQQVLKKLEDKLRTARDVSEANGFARETIESNIADLWKSLFDDDEAGEPEVIRNRITNDLFQPILGESRHSEIPTLPVYSPYILGTYFAKQELREEVVRLGVELSLYVAESMFLLCDDIHSMLRFCFKICRDDLSSPLGERLLRVMHYVYSAHIKPNNGVCRIGGKSVQWELIRTSLESFGTGIRDLHKLILILTVQGGCLDGREFTSRIEEALKKVEEKLRCAKDVSEASGFLREAMESKIWDLWKSLFDEKTKEAWTQKVMKDEILCDLFQPLVKEKEEAI